MPEIKINISDSLLEKKLRIYMAENDISSKEKAILHILNKKLNDDKKKSGGVINV